MAIQFGFEVKELENSPRWSFDRDSGVVSGEREFVVAWGDAVAFVVAMTGSHFPGFTAAQASNFAVKPYVAKPEEKTLSNFLTDINTHEFARVTIQYKSHTDNGTREEQPDGTFISYRQGSSVEYQTVPSRGLLWPSDLTVVSPDAHATIRISITEHVLTWSEIPAPPFSFISEAKGKVNDSVITIPKIGLDVDAEQLLFDSAESSTKFDASGQELWEFTYTLKERKVSALGAGGVGWNHQFRDDTYEWEKPIADVGGPNLLETADLSKLFKQA